MEFVTKQARPLKIMSISSIRLAPSLTSEEGRAHMGT